MARIFVVEDDASLREELMRLLELQGHTALTGTAFDRIVDDVLAAAPDCVILDLKLPGTGGHTVCRDLRRSSQVPVIMLTSSDSEFDEVMSMNLGADDYVTKPFDATELILRIEAHIRRHKDTIEFARCTARDGSVTIGDLEVRFDEYQVLVGGRPANLTTKEFEIVAFLATHPGKVFTRSQIQEYIWGEGEVDAHSNSITVFVRKIREKIEENPSEPKYLLTVQRVGYKMADTLG